MTEDEQSGTLAFLQNFYTGVTLYMPLTADELPLAEAPAPAPLHPEAVPASAAATVPAPKPVPALPSVPGKLPSLATVPPPAPASPLPASVAPPLPATPVSLLPPLAPTGPPPVAATPTGPPPPMALASPPPAVAPYLLTTFSTLGDNAQGVVILVRLAPEQFKKLPRNVFLNKLLQAIKLVMADVVLVNVEGPYPVALQNLRKEVAATHILAFGKNLLDITVRNTQIYEPVQFPAVGLAYLAGAEVEMIEYDVSLKKRLWGGLQRMFLA